MKLVELQFVFKVLSAETAEVVVTFEVDERRAFCRTLLYNGSFRERAYRTCEPISQTYASNLADRFVSELGS